MQQLINIDVPDLDAALAFYTRAFGLHVGRRLGEEVVELLGGAAPVYLLLKPEGSRAAGSDSSKKSRLVKPKVLCSCLRIP